MAEGKRGKGSVRAHQVDRPAVSTFAQGGSSYISAAGITYTHGYSYGQNTFNAGVCFTVLGKFHLNQSPTAKQFECASAVAGPVRPCAQELNRTCPMYEGCTRLREGNVRCRGGCIRRDVHRPWVGVGLTGAEKVHVDRERVRRLLGHGHLQISRRSHVHLRVKSLTEHV